MFQFPKPFWKIPLALPDWTFRWSTLKTYVPKPSWKCPAEFVALLWICHWRNCTCYPSRSMMWRVLSLMQIAISSIRFYGWCVGLSATIVRRTRPKHGSSLGASAMHHMACSCLSIRLWVVCTWIITRTQTNETCTFHHHSEMVAIQLALEIYDNTNSTVQTNPRYPLGTVSAAKQRGVLQSLQR